MSQLTMRCSRLDDLPDVPPLPPGYLLRTMQERDESLVAALLARAFDDAEWTPERAHQRFTADPNVPVTYLVVNEDGGFAATASVQFSKPELGLPHVGLLHWVGADPRETGKGLGYLVSLHVLHDLARRGRTEVRLKTDDHRLPALKTYLTLGFRPHLIDPTHAARWDAVAREMPPAYQSWLNERF